MKYLGLGESEDEPAANVMYSSCHLISTRPHKLVSFDILSCINKGCMYTGSETKLA